MIVGVNGRCVPEDQAVVSVFDHGFLYGIGLFETFRTYQGVPMLLERHMDRLAAGCEQLEIRCRPDPPSVKRHIRELLAANGLADGYIRYSVSAGMQPLGLPSGEYAEPTVIVYAKALPAAAASYADAPGKPLQLLRLRRNTPESDVRMKSFHYMNNVLAKRELASYAWAAQAEGLFLDHNSNVAEGIVSNLFFARGGTLCTPSLGTGILPGITRGHVLELADRLGIPAEEGHFTLEDLCQADEIFLTNSIQELVPVTVVTGLHGESLWASGGGRELGTAVHDAYMESVRQEIERYSEEGTR